MSGVIVFTSVYLTSVGVRLRVCVRLTLLGEQTDIQTWILACGLSGRICRTSSCRSRSPALGTNLRLFFQFGVILASDDLLFISKPSSIFSETSICLLWPCWHLHTFWESFGSERRVIIEIIYLELFLSPYKVFINNYPGRCTNQLNAGSLIGIRSHLEIHDYIRPNKELLGDNAWLTMGLWRSIL